MLAYIKANYKIGDAIELTSSSGVLSGTIEYIADKYIIITLSDGRLCGIAADDVRSFRAEKPAELIEPAQPAVPTLSEKDLAALRKAESVASTEATGGTISSAPRRIDDAPQVGEPKVVGRIDLDTLRQIDPKVGQRSYFKQNSFAPSANDAAAPTHMWRESSTDFVPAKGRITYYNPEKRFGFIHDYSADADLYFNLQQIADYTLFDNLHKGVKVAYSVSRNMQGYVAQCVHLPHTTDELLTMAEDYFNSQHYNLAHGLADHVLEVDPNNSEAKELLSEIADITPAARFAGNREYSSTPYNPYAIYAQAKKAYLEKDYPRAEELYQKAIDAGEKQESCVKDLVTLYVSQFKQAAEETEKNAAREKAVSFLESHRSLLPDNLTTKQFLALNYYLPIQDYEHFLSVVDEIMQDPQVGNVISRRVFYLWQKGIALNKMGKRDEALDIIDEGLKLAPHNRQLFNLQNMILHPELFARPEQDEATETATPSSAEPQPETAVQGKTAEQVEGENTGVEKSDDWWDELKKPAE